MTTATNSNGIISRTPALFTGLCIRTTAAMVSLAVNTGKLLRALPQDTGWWVSEAVRPRFDAWKVRQSGWDNYLAVVGRVEVVVSIPGATE